MNDEDIDMTAVLTHRGHLKHTSMPFGIKNAPVTFQRFIDAIFASVNWQNALQYIDDFIDSSKTSQDRLKHICEVLRFLMKADVTIKLKRVTSTINVLDT